MELNYQLTKISKFAKNEFTNLKQEQTYNTIIQSKKHTKTQSLASLTLKDNPKQLYETFQTLRLMKTLLQPRDNVRAI